MRGFVRRAELEEEWSHPPLILLWHFIPSPTCCQANHILCLKIHATDWQKSPFWILIWFVSLLIFLIGYIRLYTIYIFCNFLSLLALKQLVTWSCGCYWLILEPDVWVIHYNGKNMHQYLFLSNYTHYKYYCFTFVFVEIKSNIALNIQYIFKKWW